MAFISKNFTAIVSDGLFVAQSAPTESQVCIREITPHFGLESGGKTINIFISSPDTQENTTVLIGGQPAEIVDWVTYTSSWVRMSVITPVGTGTVDVRVQTVNNSFDVWPSGFVYTLPTESAIGLFLYSLENKLKTITLITNPDNVLIGESQDLLMLTDEEFPRMEVLITKDKGDGYSSQREMDFAFRYSIAGYIKRGKDAVNWKDMVDLTNFGVEARVKNYSFLDDAQLGDPPCPGFLKMGGFSDTFYEFEIIPQISTFILNCEVHIQLSDTEVQ